VRTLASWSVNQDPMSGRGTTNYLKGVQGDGSSWTCSGGTTRFPNGGDPVSGTGCVDTTPGDKRILLSVGPFNVFTFGTVDVTVVYLIGWSPASARSADNVQVLRDLLQQVRKDWAPDSAVATPAPAQVALRITSANPFRDVAEMELALPKDAVAQRLEVLDTRGRLVWEEPVRTAYPGTYTRVSWDGRTKDGVPARSGLYFVRVVTDRGAVSQRFVRLR